METQVEQYELTHADPEAVELTAVLAALAEPVRLKIVRTVAALGPNGEMACLDVWQAGGFTATKSTMSHHYKVLREAGLVLMWWVGSKKHVRLRRELVDARWPGLLDAVLADQAATGSGAAVGADTGTAGGPGAATGSAAAANA